jgi:protein-tyrosine-phosphatase
VAIFAMTEGHRNFLQSLFPDSEVPILLFRELMGADAEVQVPDPFGGSLQAYEETRDALAEAIPSILAYLRTEVGQARDEA